MNWYLLNINVFHHSLIKYLWVKATSFVNAFLKCLNMTYHMINFV